MLDEGPGSSGPIFDRPVPGSVGVTTTLYDTVLEFIVLVVDPNLLVNRAKFVYVEVDEELVFTLVTTVIVTNSLGKSVPILIVTVRVEELTV